MLPESHVGQRPRGKREAVMAPPLLVRPSKHEKG